MGSREAVRVGMLRFAAAFFLALAPVGLQAQCQFLRGDVNSTGTVDLNDGVDLLSHIYLGNTVPPCIDASDVNDNGVVELSDYLYLARWVFEQGPPPPAPFPEMGPDPTPGTSVPTERDPRFTFKLGEAIGFATNTGLRIPLYISNQVPIHGFQMAFQFSGDLLRIDEMLPDETALKEANAEYIIHQAINRPGNAMGGYSALIDFVTPIQFRTLPPGQDQLVGNIVVSISLIASSGETALEFVDGLSFRELDDPARQVKIENLVVLDTGTALRPILTNGKVIIRKAFIRGDSNQDKRVDIADPVFSLNYVFSGGTHPQCMDAADVNNDSRVDISDPIFCLDFLFTGGARPSSPFPFPGVDPDHDRLDCADDS